MRGALTDICAEYTELLTGAYPEPDPATRSEYEFIFSHNREMIIGLKACKTTRILRNWTMQWQENGDGALKEFIFGPEYE